jgi:hypothetical protein
MANDLQVAGLNLPTPVTGRCLATVTVDVVNAGSDPAVLPVPLTVCLEIRGTREGVPVAHYVVATGAEAPPIAPHAVRTFTFTGVQFPCSATASVTATADCHGTVPNNARTNPSLTVFVPRIAAVPWLWADIRVGLRDSTGHVEWAPGALCPGATCVAEVIIRNEGCAVAVASVTTLEVLDGGGVSIAAFKQNTAPIHAGVTSVVQFVTTLPAGVSGNSLTLRGCADATGAVIGQCSLANACASVTLPLASASGGPRLTFTANKPVFPGEAVPLSWRIQNFCTDIGRATARISFQGNVLYTSVAIPIGLQGPDTGEDVVVAPAASVAANFYKVGSSVLELEITGTGADPGPYVTTVAVTVTLEPVSGNWIFTMPVQPAMGTANFPWKASYVVSGRLSNPARAAMLPSSVVLDEVASVGSPVARIASPPLGNIVPGAFGTAIWSLMQVWSWLAPGVWTPIGPWSAGFTYSVTFAMQDAYGNAYPPSTSATTFVAINVAASKIAFATVAKVFFGIGVGLLIAAGIAAAHVITIVPALVLLGLAGVAFTVATGFGIAALDPPVPDFDYQRLVPTRPPVFPPVLRSHAVGAPLLPLFALLSRISEFNAVMTATQARLIAARIDRDSSAAQWQADEYAALRDALEAAARQVPLAAVQALDDVRAQELLQPLVDATALQKQADTWAETGLPKALRGTWLDNGLPERQLEDVEQALRTKGFEARPLDVLLADLTQASALMASAVHDESALVLEPLAATPAITRAEGHGGKAVG